MIMKNKNITINMNGGQFNCAKDNSTMKIVQYNYGANAYELDHIIKGIMDNLSVLNKEDADEVANTVGMVKEELMKPEPTVSKLRYYLTLIAPMFTVANGIPKLLGDLQKLVDYVTLYIR